MLVAVIDGAVFNPSGFRARVAFLTGPASKDFEMLSRDGHGRLLAFAESFLYFRITTRDSVADDDAIGRGREVFAFVAVRDVDAELFEHRGHRRIDVQVRSGYVMAARLKHAGQRSHRCSANAD